MMTGEIKFKNLDKFNKQIKKKIEESIKDERVLKEVGDTALAHVKARIKLGKQPDENKAHTKPSKAWQKKREQLVKSGKVKPSESYKKTQPLVFSGQLVESLSFKINKSKARLTLFAKGTHKAYEKGGKSIANSKLLEYIREKREIFGFTDQKKKEIVNIVKRGIRRALK